MGQSSTASGNSSTAMGFYTNAFGSYSTAMGAATIAKNESSLVIGYSNDTTNTNTLFEIGNGISTSNRSNAFTVTKNGDVTMAGKIVNEAIQTPTLLGNWTNSGGSYENAGFYKDKESVVHLKGLVANGVNAPGSTVFTLPAGYRPVGNRIFVVMNNNAFGRVDIEASGNVVLSSFNGVNGWLSLDGISFRTN